MSWILLSDELALVGEKLCVVSSDEVKVVEGMMDESKLIADVGGSRDTGEDGPEVGEKDC